MRTAAFVRQNDIWDRGGSEAFDVSALCRVNHGYLPAQMTNMSKRRAARLSGRDGRLQLSIRTSVLSQGDTLYIILFDYGMKNLSREPKRGNQLLLQLNHLKYKCNYKLK